MYVAAPPTGDAKQYAEVPHLVHVPEKSGMPRDFEELGGIWVISQALKDVFDVVDPEAFAFAACEFTLADGAPGPQYYFCNVIRTLDVPASRVKVRRSRISSPARKSRSTASSAVPHWSSTSVL